jgi:tetratricopeptide (TPR) repeat protein
VVAFGLAVARVRLDPRLRADAEVRAGYAALGAGDVAGAQAAVERAVALDPHSVTAWRAGCRLAGQRRDDPATERWCSGALGIDDANAYALALRAAARARSGREAEAETDFRRALELTHDDSTLIFAVETLAPVRPGAVDRMCQTRLTTDVVPIPLVVACANAAAKPEIARIRYQQAASIRAYTVPDREARARALVALGRLDEAIREWTKAHDMAPDDAGVLNNLAWAELAAGRRDDALAHAEAAVALGPDAARWNTRCMARLVRGDAAGIEDCRKALALAPGSPVDLGAVDWVEGRRDDATAKWAAMDDPLLALIVAQLTAP